MHANLEDARVVDHRAHVDPALRGVVNDGLVRSIHRVFGGNIQDDGDQVGLAL